MQWMRKVRAEAQAKAKGEAMTRSNRSRRGASKGNDAKNHRRSDRREALGLSEEQARALGMRLFELAPVKWIDLEEACELYPPEPKRDRRMFVGKIEFGDASTLDMETGEITHYDRSKAKR